MQAARGTLTKIGQIRAGLMVAGLLAWVLTLSGCDQLGIETPEKAAERQTADAKAIGGGCRHAMRAIEDCYVLNPKADRSSVFAGWREMDEYMRENKLEGIAPVVPRPPPPMSGASKPAKASEPSDEDEVADEHAAKAEKGKPAKSGAH